MQSQMGIHSHESYYLYILRLISVAILFDFHDFLAWSSSKFSSHVIVLMVGFYVRDIITIPLYKQ